METKPHNIVIKQHTSILIGDPRVEFHSGCKVIDVSFPKTFFVEVSEIHFKNFFTESVKIKALVKSASADAEPSWQTCVKHLQLMPLPHSEKGAEDYCIVNHKLLTAELQNISGLRFILRQSSPIWKDFKLEDVKVFKSASTLPVDVPLPEWYKSGEKKSDKVKQVQGVAPVETVSSILQKMWMLTQEAANSQPSANLGRYEVDDCYEINLLSYT